MDHDAAWLRAIERHGPGPAYRRIYDRFRAAIADGTLKPGDRVPSSRALAGRLGAARGTVEEAYQMLASEGYVTRRGQAGTIISLELASLGGQITSPPPAPTPHQQTTTKPAINPFALGVPSFDMFPRKLWARIGSSEGKRLDDADLAHPIAVGHPALRQAVARHLALARGITCDWRDVVVTSGYQGALGVLLPLLLGAGDQVWLEDPGYPPARHAVTATGARIVPVAVDESGMRVDDATAAAPDARLAVVTPSHQSPTGATLSLKRRLALLAWATARGSWIIEDDYDGEFHYTGRLLPALKSLDGGQNVIYIGSFSKTLHPALRLGYMVLPARLQEAVDAAIRLRGATQASMAQKVVARFMADGHFNKHLRNMRVLYRARRQALTDALAAVFPDALAVIPRDGGMQIVAGITTSVRDTAITAHAARAGVIVHALSSFASVDRGDNALVFGFTNLPAGQALARCEALRRTGAFDVNG